MQNRPAQLKDEACPPRSYRLEVDWQTTQPVPVEIRRSASHSPFFALPGHMNVMDALNYALFQVEFSPE